MPRVVRNGNFRKYKPMSHKPKTGKAKPQLKMVTVSVQISSKPESSIRVFSNGDQTGEVTTHGLLCGSTTPSKYRIRVNKFELLQIAKELQIGDIVTISGTSTVGHKTYPEICVQTLEHVSIKNFSSEETKNQSTDE